MVMVGVQLAGRNKMQNKEHQSEMTSSIVTSEAERCRSSLVPHHNEEKEHINAQ